MGQHFFGGLPNSVLQFPNSFGGLVSSTSGYLQGVVPRFFSHEHGVFF